MSRPARFEDVTRHVAEFGERAMLVTVSGTGAPHVVSVVIEVGDERLLARVGPTTRANLTDRPAVSLVWAPLPGGEYQLLLDGAASAADGEPSGNGVSTISIDVTSGILHRLAELPGEAPSCIALGTD